MIFFFLSNVNKSTKIERVNALTTIRMDILDMFDSHFTKYLFIRSVTKINLVKVVRLPLDTFTDNFVIDMRAFNINWFLLLILFANGSIFCQSTKLNVIPRSHSANTYKIRLKKLISPQSTNQTLTLVLVFPKKNSHQI